MRGPDEGIPSSFWGVLIVCSWEHKNTHTHAHCWIMLIIQPAQLLSKMKKKKKKLFAFSCCNFWGSDCSWSVKSHVDTCHVGMARGLGKYIWMNIDISLAPCGVSSGERNACKTLKNIHRQSLNFLLLFSPSFFIFHTWTLRSALSWTEMKGSQCSSMTFKIAIKSKSG